MQARKTRPRAGRRSRFARGDAGTYQRVPTRHIPPELIAVARRLYETTDTPPAEIAGLLGLPVGTFYWRVLHKWRWIRRKYYLPRTLPRH